MEQHDGLGTGPERESSGAGAGHPADAATAPRRHAATRPARRRSERTGGNHRAGAGRPATKAAALAVGAVVVTGAGLTLIWPGSGAGQALAADPATPARPIATVPSAPSTPSSTWHSPRRHKPSSPTASASASATEQHEDGRTPPETNAATERAHPTHQAATQPHRGSVSGAGRATSRSGSGSATGTAAEFARKVLELVNAQRAQAGCAPLTVDRRIQAAAQAHSDDMAARNYYAHDTPEGVDPGTRMTNAGFHWQSWAENIFKSPKDPATAVDGWMNSPGHRANILNCSYKSTGVGVNLSSNGPWWTQDFATGS
ncbi:CAP domain-containing protein [Streptomyces sp. NPDC090442]|uniref:CAP domain-containing protein n=1 Tax=Streptomyces sp. NPDC090442 TaxID=3365962 RepID=UPI00380ECAB9